MIAVNGENGYSDVEVLVFVIDSRESVSVSFGATSIVRDMQTDEKPGAAPSMGSLRSSNCNCQLDLPACNSCETQVGIRDVLRDAPI